MTKRYILIMLISAAFVLTSCSRLTGINDTRGEGTAQEVTEDSETGADETGDSGIEGSKTETGSTETDNAEADDTNADNMDINNTGTNNIDTGFIATGLEGESERASAYLSVIQDLMEKHGESRIVEKEFLGEYAAGLSVVRLIDFDGDGKVELYCAYQDTEVVDAAFGRGHKQVIYGYEDALVLLMEESPVSNPGTDVCTTTQFLRNNDKVYLVEIDEFVRGTYYSLVDGKMTCVLSYYDSSVWDGDEFTLNGVNSTEAEIQAATTQIAGGGQYERIEYIVYKGDPEMPAMLDVTEKTIAYIREKSE